MAQWIYICHPSCCPGFESYAHHLCFYHFFVKFVLYLFLHCEKNESVNKKRPDLVQFFFKKIAAHISLLLSAEEVIGGAVLGKLLQELLHHELLHEIEHLVTALGRLSLGVGEHDRIRDAELLDGWWSKAKSVPELGQGILLLLGWPVEEGLDKLGGGPIEFIYDD